MSTRKISIALLSLCALLLPAPQALAAQPAWQLSDTAMPTNFTPGSEATNFGPSYLLVATNVGDEPTGGGVTFKDTLPEGIEPIAVSARDSGFEFHKAKCEIIAKEEVTCTHTNPIYPGHHLEVVIGVKVEASASGDKLNQATITGGGATTASSAITTTIATSLPSFEFLPGFEAPLTDSEGKATTQAGGHPGLFGVEVGFPIEKTSKESLGAIGHLRDSFVDLPRGEIVDPAATPVLCTEAQLISQAEEPCPRASQVGTVTITTVAVGPEAAVSPLYNMVPPPGAPASLATDALGIGVFPHLTGTLRSDGDYGISGGFTNIDALGLHPIFGGRVEIWGDPTSSAHDGVRGECAFAKKLVCTPEETSHIAMLSTPTQCTGQPSVTLARADSWEQPGVFEEESYESADLAGSPVSLAGCNQLNFEPTITAKPTTNLIDSPSGLNVDLHQPQDTDVEGRSTAALKDAFVGFPEGMTANTAQAGGLDVCTTEEIGLTTEVGEAPIHFSKQPDSCPDAAKIGTMEVASPLLAQTDESGTKVQYDSKGNAIPRPLHGSVYLAKPFQNPFGSLLAVYLSVNDPKSGTVAKLAGEAEADPVTGQLSTRFEENPELPLEDVRVHLFDGARAPLRTPSACATYTTETELTPWSSPEGAGAEPSDSFGLTATPAAGGCPSTPQGAPNAPSFEAGTVDPKAGSYSPFAMKIARTDGTQPPSGFEITLPPGLIGKPAGIPYCSEADIAKAKARSNPEEGKLELADPSCPAASQIGTVDVGVGAGPTPFHASGRVYFAGPYKGAPISFVVISPAVAGPFDLGTVVVRAAAYIDPERAQVRTVTDPLPTILEGIPLDVRTVALRLDHPDFTLNPTNCDPMSIDAKLTSVFGNVAPLTNRFQVGGCNELAFKPKLSIRLKGQTKRTGHPALSATLRATPGQANLKRIAVTLPRSEFLDQAHIGTVCTRVQFAANQCPAASVYGSARVFTPLLDQPLEGPVYLRSSSHELPDLVLALHGQVDVVLDGRIDSVNGGIRTTFEASPDAPFTKAVLEMKGGRKGLLINSANLCKLKVKDTRATVKMEGQNAKRLDSNPVLQNSCAKKPSHKHKKHGHKGHR